jgi:hypothetical protein
VRQYILTDTERKMLETYAKTGVKLQDFRVLMFRIKKAHKSLKNDFKLIDDVLQKSQ